MKNKIKKLTLGLGVVCASLAFASCGKEESNYESAEIKVYTRDTTSGTRDGFFTTIGFKEAVSNNDVLVDGVVVRDSNGDMVTAIQNDEYGIGYVSLASVLENENIKGLTYENVSPTEENVVNGTYKLTRNFNYCTRTSYNTEAEADIVEALIAYMSTVEGQATIQSEDGIIEEQSTVSWEDIKGNYPICTQDNSSITISFGGSTSVEKIAKALSSDFSERCGNFKYSHTHTGSGDAYKRTQGSESNGANYLSMAFASREFKLTGDEPLQEGTYNKLCIDAIVAVVNKNNPLTSVTKETLKGIYEGTITKWSSVE